MAHRTLIATVLHTLTWTMYPVSPITWVRETHVVVVRTAHVLQLSCNRTAHLGMDQVAHFARVHEAHVLAARAADGGQGRGVGAAAVGDVLGQEGHPGRRTEPVRGIL